MVGVVGQLKNLLGRHSISTNAAAQSNRSPTTQATPTPATYTRVNNIPEPAPAPAPAPAVTAPPIPQPRQAAAPQGISPSATTVQAENLVRRENEARAKRERAPYQGLPEGVTLGRKMGDGAFSNVFQANLKPTAAQLAIDPTLGDSVSVAVKCVRKFELSQSQVSSLFSSSFFLFLSLLFFRRYPSPGQWPVEGRIPLRTAVATRTSRGGAGLRGEKLKDSIRASSLPLPLPSQIYLNSPQNKNLAQNHLARDLLTGIQSLLSLFTTLPTLPCSPPVPLLSLFLSSERLYSYCATSPLY